MLEEAWKAIAEEYEYHDAERTKLQDKQIVNQVSSVRFNL